MSGHYLFHASTTKSTLATGPFHRHIEERLILIKGWLSEDGPELDVHITSKKQTWRPAISPLTSLSHLESLSDDPHVSEDGQENASFPADQEENNPESASTATISPPESLHIWPDSEAESLQDFPKEPNAPLKEAFYNLVNAMHPSEIAYMIRYLEEPWRKKFIRRLKSTFDPQIFLFLTPNILVEILDYFSQGEIAGFVKALKSDDAFFIISVLGEKRQKRVLQALPQTLRDSFLQRLTYPADSAGRLMQKEVATLQEGWSAQESLRHLRHTPHVSEALSEIFVLNDVGQVVGSLPLTTLLRAENDELISTLLKTHVFSVLPTCSQEEVALMFRLYNLMCAPVVNESGELIGMITADDVIDVIEREASEDLMYMGGIHHSDFYQSVLKTSFSRIHWLILTLINTILTALVINEFQETLQAKVALTILMPVAAAMGGNTGIQAATVIIRALATQELNRINMVRTFFKEIRVALINGMVLATFLGMGTYLWFKDTQFACVLFGAVLFNMIWAGCAGALFPVIISFFKGDPALSSGSLITTTTDVIGYSAFLSLARLFMI